MYIQRYVPHFPAAGEVVIFDRSWYNRAGVERVMGFCTEEQASVSCRWSRWSRGRWSIPASFFSSTGWRSVPRSRPAGSSASRTSQDLEALPDGFAVLQPLVRLLTGARCDVRGDGYAWAPWYVGAIGRQEAARSTSSVTCCSQIPYEDAAARKGEAAQAAKARRLSGTGLSVQVHPGSVLKGVPLGLESPVQQRPHPIRAVDRSGPDPQGHRRDQKRLSSIASIPTRPRTYQHPCRPPVSASGELGHGDRLATPPAPNPPRCCFLITKPP